ncbi:hypothetical protein [Ilumatobacter fluminis]|uniref:hypothetical protein n=1 Tax=Ilumatobacter fluminis TaxID=467091 RepID=UPI00105D3EC3|nr:hypothetical protein [Ilumatobacter fluminis]
MTPPVVAGGIWASWWLLLRVTGQGYSLRPVYAGYQFVPADDLFDAPVSAVWSLHIQPPVWNLVVGAAGGWSPFGDALTLQLVTLALGIGLAASLCALLGALGAPPGWAVGLTALATLNAQVMLHAFEPRYDFAVATLTCLLVWTTTRPAGSRWAVAAPIVVSTTLAATRTLYHPVWLVGVVVLVLIAHRRVLRPANVAVAIAVPLVVIGGWAVKNQVVVERPTVSTLTGMNLLRSVSPATDETALEQMTTDGRISEIWRVGLARWALDGPCLDADQSGTGALDSPTRTLPRQYRTGAFDDGVVPNYNARCFLVAYDQASSDASTIIREHPGAWVRGRLWAANNWFGLPEVDPADRSALWTPLELGTRAALVGAPHPPLPDSWGAPSLWVHRTPVSILLITLSGAVLVTGVRRGVAVGRDGAAHLPEIVAAWTVAWTLVAGIAFELGEQVRFRNAIDPLVIGLGGWLLIDAVRRRRSGRDANSRDAALSQRNARP